jgi:AcrR family transcriptional regulator
MKQATGSVRDDILSAAEQLILEAGLGAATTRAIAKAAGCAEGSIYRHFPDKDALVVEVVKTCFPDFVAMLCALPERVGTGTVLQTLQELGTVALGFYRGILPIAAGVLSDQDLLAKNQASFKATETGPAKALEAVTNYLIEEQRLGRVSKHVSAGYGAKMILGTFFSQAFFEELSGDGPGPAESDARMVKGVAELIWRGLKP